MLFFIFYKRVKFYLVEYLLMRKEMYININIIVKVNILYSFFFMCVKVFFIGSRIICVGGC